MHGATMSSEEESVKEEGVAPGAGVAPGGGGLDFKVPSLPSSPAGKPIFNLNLGCKIFNQKYL